MMQSAAELISEATSLPVEDRVLIVDSLLKSLHSPSDAIDSIWGKVALDRLEQARSGAVQAISGSDVQAKVRARFGQ